MCILMVSVQKTGGGINATKGSACFQISCHQLVSFVPDQLEPRLSTYGGRSNTVKLYTRVFYIGKYCNIVICPDLGIQSASKTMNPKGFCLTHSPSSLNSSKEMPSAVRRPRATQMRHIFDVLCHSSNANVTSSLTTDRRLISSACIHGTKLSTLTITPPPKKKKNSRLHPPLALRHAIPPCRGPAGQLTGQTASGHGLRWPAGGEDYTLAESEFGTAIARIR